MDVILTKKAMYHALAIKGESLRLALLARENIGIKMVSKRWDGMKLREHHVEVKIYLRYNNILPLNIKDEPV